MVSANNRRVLIIALDGATFDVIRPLVERGELPCIGAMMRRGVSAPLLSTLPPITPPAWSSLATGAAPIEHGVFGFNYPDADYSLRMTTAADLERATLWRRLSDHGLGVLMIDVPFTFPPEELNGAVLAGFPIYGESEFAHPRDLPARLAANGIACVRHPNEAPDPASPEFMRWLDEIASNRLAIFQHLSQSEPWRFAMIGTMAIDWAQHDLWRYYDRRFALASRPEATERRERLFAIYRWIDRWIADLAAAAGDDATILIVSDHGFGAAFHYDWIAEALANAGLLHWRTERANLGRRLLHGALKAVRSSSALQRVARAWLGARAGRVRRFARAAHAYDQIDWERTRIFPAGDFNLNWHVNTRNRFARGIVQSDAEYKAVLDTAVAVLERLRPPHRPERVVRRIARIEGGARAMPTRVPDLTLELEPLPPLADSESATEIPGICAFHAPEGVLVANSTEWLGIARPEAMQITEIAPAILRWLDVPFDTKETRSGAPSRECSEEESAAVLSQLRRLGYVD